MVFLWVNAQSKMHPEVGVVECIDNNGCSARGKVCSNGDVTFALGVGRDLE